jgi:hypothetical protein
VTTRPHKQPGRIPEQDPSNLEEVLDRISHAEANAGRVSLGTILHEMEHRSFGSLLLLAGLVTLMPVTGESLLMGIFVLLIAGQMLLLHRHFWLPRRLLRLSIRQDRLCRTLDRLQPSARFVDRLLRHRLTPLVRGTGAYLIAVVCVMIALVMPVLELVPFSAFGAGFVLSLFGLALIGRDGLLALIALVITAATAWFVLHTLSR